MILQEYSLEKLNAILTEFYEIPQLRSFFYILSDYFSYQLNFSINLFVFLFDLIPARLLSTSSNFSHISRVKRVSYSMFVKFFTRVRKINVFGW